MKHFISANNPMRAQFSAQAAYQTQHFSYAFDAGIATITLNRPDKKNPLTFDSYGELRDLFRAFVYATDVKAVVFTGSGGNFCSGGDVHEIIGPLTKMSMPEMLEFTRMTGDLVKAIKACPQPVIAAIDGICAGAGAMIALAADMRLGTPLHPRRPRRRRHGRMRPAPPHDRPRPRSGAALHRPRDECARRFELGLLQRITRKR
jgi:hypothetical protein